MKIDVLQKRFETTYSTLTRHQCFFTGLLSGSFDITRDESGAIFVDRDGDLFGVILSWMRTGALCVPLLVDRSQLLQEAEYYSLSDLSEVLHEMNAKDEAQQRQALHPTIRVDGFYVSESGHRGFLFRPIQEEEAGRGGTFLFVDVAKATDPGLNAELQLSVIDNARHMPALWRDERVLQHRYATFFARFVTRGRWWQDAPPVGEGGSEGECNPSALKLLMAQPPQESNKSELRMALVESDSLMVLEEEAFVRYHFRERNIDVSDYW